MFMSNNTFQPSPHDHKSIAAQSNKRIMVVDDEAQIRALLTITLSRPGFAVITAESTMHALTLLDTITPDLFVVDVMMPGLDGLELCRQIRARPETATTPILVVSARNDAEIVKKALAAGATDFISKLIPQTKLIVRIRELLNLHSSNMH